MSYTIISWEVSTGDPARAARITQAAEQAVAAFNPAQLLVGCFLVDTENENVENIRQALDGVVGAFPQEFFFTTAKQPEADIQGIYPPFAELPDAHVITGSARNPLQRPVPAPGPRVPFALAAGTRAGARPRPKASRRKAGRKKTGGVSRRRSRGGTR